MKFISRKIPYLLLVISFFGILDAGYLTYVHYFPLRVACPVNGIIDCGRVVWSDYSLFFGIPVALMGLAFYLSTYLASFLLIKFKDSKIIKQFVVMGSTAAFIFSVYFVYIQLFVLYAICTYCMFSALTSTLLFLISLFAYCNETKELKILIIGLVYQSLLKKIFFLIDAEVVHEGVVNFGQSLGNSIIAKRSFGYLFNNKEKSLSQNILGIEFDSPIGLAAGFDYEAKLTQFLPYLGFGFATAGTITNLPYSGNPKPMLGRLPRSRSLMVNKGFKNSGVENISKKLKKLKFDYVQGISIGRSNNKSLTTQRRSISDIISAFKTFDKNKVRNLYYELNISCPNLIYGDVDFYERKKLDELLTAIDKLKLNKPVFIKMPIEKSDKEVLAMLKVISKHSPKGVIFGNLQKDKNNPSLDKEEVSKFKMGYFSGKPTFDRSNELIKLAYKSFGKKLVVIGCGGVFSAEDAYAKIKLGASLVQLITGLIYQGPQLTSEINYGLIDLLRKDGYKNISEAVGVNVK